MKIIEDFVMKSHKSKRWFRNILISFVISNVTAFSKSQVSLLEIVQKFILFFYNLHHSINAKLSTSANYFSRELEPTTFYIDTNPGKAESALKETWNSFKLVLFYYVDLSGSLRLEIRSITNSKRAYLKTDGHFAKQV